MTVIDHWLLALADPEGPSAQLPKVPLTSDQLTNLTVLAEIHGVLPALLANLDRVFAQNPGVILTDTKALTDIRTTLSPMQQRVAERAALALFLTAEAQKLCRALAADGVAAMLIKGGDFATRLYRPTALRTFVDVDLLISPADWPRAEAVMGRLGFSEQKSALKYTSGYAERTWEHPSLPGAMFEIHDNLVNSPTLRRGVAVALADLPQAPAPRQGTQFTPAALLVIASVHAAASHGFDKVQQLYDLRQIIRGRAGPIEEPEFRRCVQQTGAGLCVGAALHLVRQAFDDPADRDLARRWPWLKPHWLTNRLLSPWTVVTAQGKRQPHAAWRRRWFRQLLKYRR